MYLCMINNINCISDWRVDFQSRTNTACTPSFKLTIGICLGVMLFGNINCTVNNRIQTPLETKRRSLYTVKEYGSHVCVAWVLVSAGACALQCCARVHRVGGVEGGLHGYADIYQTSVHCSCMCMCLCLCIVSGSTYKFHIFQ